MASTPDAKVSDSQKTTVDDLGSGVDKNEKGEASEAEATAGDPGDKIPDFDWEGLQQRFQDEMERCRASEAALNEELENLIKYFNIWASTTTLYETQRAQTRLMTRVAHVQHSEDNLENRRDHYNQVVTKFSEACELLMKSMTP